MLLDALLKNSMNNSNHKPSWKDLLPEKLITSVDIKISWISKERKVKLKMLLERSSKKMTRLDLNASITLSLRAVDTLRLQLWRKTKTLILNSVSELLQVLLKPHKTSLILISNSNWIKESLRWLSKLTLLITRNGNLILNSQLSSMTQLQTRNILEMTLQLKSLFWMKISQVNLVSKLLRFKLPNSRIELISRLLEAKDPVELSAAWLELNNLLKVEELLATVLLSLMTTFQNTIKSNC